MSQIRVHQNRNRVRLGYEEEKAWRGFYQHVGNPDIATEVLKELDADEEMKRAHLALYMSCKQTLRTTKNRQARNRRIGYFVRWLAEKVCVTPWRVVMGWLRQSGDVAVECLPEIRKEPAARQVGQFSNEVEFAQAKATFDAKEEKGTNDAAEAKEATGATEAKEATPSPSGAKKKSASKASG